MVLGDSISVAQLRPMLLDWIEGLTLDLLLGLGLGPPRKLGKLRALLS